MEPHSRPYPSHDGTLRLPQALVLLLKSALAGPTSNSVTQTVAGPARWQSIKNLSYRLALFINPFVVSGDWFSSLLVGMVKLTVICGFGSALWLWARRNRKGKVASSTVDQQSANAVGKEPQTIPDFLFHDLFPWAWMRCASGRPSRGVPCDYC